MKLSAIILARVLGFIETFDLAPRGKVFYPEFARAVVDRFKFQKFPQTFEEFDETKGIVFEEGRIGNHVIQKFTIFSTLLVIETRSNTSDSKQILEEMLAWGAAKFDLNYKPGAIKKFAYLSGLTFYSDVPLLGAGSQPIIDLGVKTSEAVSAIWGEPITYYPAAIAVGHDPMARKNGVASFTLSYRAETKFTDNKYFSEAPLPTDMHIEFLESFETGNRNIVSQRGNG